MISTFQADFIRTGIALGNEEQKHVITVKQADTLEHLQSEGFLTVVRREDVPELKRSIVYVSGGTGIKENSEEISTE